MAFSLNEVKVLGYVGKEPQVNNTQSGTLVVNLSVATSERYKDQQGNYQEKTEWHNLVAFSRQAEIIRDYVKKGSKVFVEGKLQTRSWEDKDTGKKAYRTEIIVNRLGLLDPREDGDNTGSNGHQNHSNQSNSKGNSRSNSNNNAYTRAGGGQQEDYSDLGIDSSDIPF
jgi:single-strand DNA-binding protein